MTKQIFHMLQPISNTGMRFRYIGQITIDPEEISLEIKITYHVGIYRNPCDASPMGKWLVIKLNDIPSLHYEIKVNNNIHTIISQDPKTIQSILTTLLEKKPEKHSFEPDDQEFNFYANDFMKKCSCNPGEEIKHDHLERVAKEENREFSLGNKWENYTIKSLAEEIGSQKPKATLEKPFNVTKPFL